MSVKSVQTLLNTCNNGQLLWKKNIEEKFCKRVRMRQLRQTVQCGPHKTSCELSHLKHASAFTRNGWREVKGAREMGRGKDLLVRPPGRGMLSTLHPGKGSLRSSGPICSRRGK